MDNEVGKRFVMSSLNATVYIFWEDMNWRLHYEQLQNKLKWRQFEL